MTEKQTSHDQEIDHLEGKCQNLESRITQLQSEKDALRQATQAQLNSLTENEKAKGDRLGESIQRL